MPMLDWVKGNKRFLKIQEGTGDALMIEILGRRFGVAKRIGMLYYYRRLIREVFLCQRDIGWR